MEQWTGSKLRKEYVKAVYCHPAYLTSVQSEVKVVQSCLTFCDPVECSLSGSSVYRIIQAILLEWVSCIAGWFLQAELSGKPPLYRVCHAKCWAGWITSWNQDCWEKYQQPQMCRWCHLMAESEEELKSLLIRVKEEIEKAGLKLNIQKAKIMASHHFIANRGGNNGNRDRLYFGGVPKSLQPWN